MKKLMPAIVEQAAPSHFGRPWGGDAQPLQKAGRNFLGPFLPEWRHPSSQQGPHQKTTFLRSFGHKCANIWPSSAKPALLSFRNGAARPSVLSSISQKATETGTAWTRRRRLRRVARAGLREALQHLDGWAQRRHRFPEVCGVLFLSRAKRERRKSSPDH